MHIFAEFHHFANWRNIQMILIWGEHFTPSLVVSHFSTHSEEAWLFFFFLILFLIQSWRFVNKNPSIIKPRQFLIKSGQLTALEKQWNLRRNSRQQALDILPFIGQFIPVCEWTISCCFFMGWEGPKILGKDVRFQQ